jgi:ketosteroid isomerase-like protein
VGLGWRALQLMREVVRRRTGPAMPKPREDSVRTSHLPRYRATLLLAGAAAFSLPTALPAQSDAVLVRAADSAWARAVEARLVDQVLAFYDPDAVTAGRAMFPARGLPELRAAWAGAFAQTDWRLTWQVDSVAIAASGTVAYSTGRWRQLSPTPLAGVYLAVWKKSAGGRWRVLIDAAW